MASIRRAFFLLAACRFLGTSSLLAPRVSLLPGTAAAFQQVRWARTSRSTGLKGSKGFGPEVDPGEIPGISLRVLKYPHPQLRADNTPVTEFDESLQRLSDDMFVAMHATKGLGLAAPQVGVNKRFMVFIDKTQSPIRDITMVNPRIAAQGTRTTIWEEGCLSFPNLYGYVERFDWVEVEYQTVTGKAERIRLDGAPAAVFQHEYDHLDKVLFIDRMKASSRLKLHRQIQRLILNHGPGGAL